MAKSTRSVTCAVSGQTIPIAEAVPIHEIRKPIRELVEKQIKPGSESAYVSQDVLNRIRLDRIQHMLVEDKREVTKLEREVLESVDDRRILARDPLSNDPEAATVGERLADRVASFGGSWAFIIAFFTVLVSWIALNGSQFLAKPFDPFPFILLNLILSCLAAIQAPIIMMSQNRQEAKDRLRSMHDYQVNLKAEIEVRALHDKLDRLIGHQWQQLLEIQQMQMDMLKEMREQRK